MIIDVKELVRDSLVKNGFGGLFLPADDEGCACNLQDLMPCGDYPSYCEAGYEVPCNCGEYDFHIVREDK